MGEDGCFGEGSTPAESIAVTSSIGIIIFEMGIRLFYHHLTVSNLSLIKGQFIKFWSRHWK